MDLFLDNPVWVGASVLVVVVIMSIVDKHYRNTEPPIDNGPLGDEHLNFPTEEEVESASEEQTNNYYPEPSSDLMPLPMNSMQPVF
ncbi:hypothetical protein COB52_04375 [Candidatus Kaiserbacteria bacterium]|nr:MAG: hypothetical protein COB52_04375 [Candidatus Kaiserbacteria bacterium]